MLKWYIYERIFNNTIQTNKVMKVGAEFVFRECPDDADDDLLGSGGSIISPPVAIEPKFLLLPIGKNNILSYWV